MQNAVIPGYDTIISILLNKVDLILHGYVYSGYQHLADHLRGPLGLAVTLYIAVTGLSIALGWINLSWKHLTHSVFKIGLIYMLAMNWGNFSEYVVGLFQTAAGQIGDWMVTATPIPLPTFAGTGIDGALQSVLIEVTKIGYWTWKQGSFHAWGPFFGAILMWACGYIALVLAFIEILVAKVMLSVLFVMAPLIIPLALFKKTQGMCDRWVGSLCGFALYLVFIPAALALILNLMQVVLGGMYVQKAMNVTIVGFVPVLFVGILGVVLVLKVTQYATSIGGGASIASGASMMAGAVGGVMGAMLAGGGFLGKGTGMSKAVTGTVMKGAGWFAGELGHEIKDEGSSLMQGIRSKLSQGQSGASSSHDMPSGSAANDG